jgi:hypothetical protein
MRRTLIASVPRSEAALDAQSELPLNQKRRFYQIVPEVRLPAWRTMSVASATCLE